MSFKIFVFDKPHFPPTREDFLEITPIQAIVIKIIILLQDQNSATNNFIIKLELNGTRAGFQFPLS